MHKTPKPHLLEKLSRLLVAIIVLFSSNPFIHPIDSVHAAAILDITPVTWNVIGLDSNNVTVGPNVFPVGARVCNSGDTDATDIVATFDWLETTNASYIFLRPGTAPSYSNGVDLAPGECDDYFFEVQILRNSASYNRTRDFEISFSEAGGASGVTPSPREIYVEKLVSQNRNEVTDIHLDGVSIPPGGTMTLMVGQTYDITLFGHTATAYNQLESYINLSNTIFRINSVSSTYSTVSYAPPYLDKLYADSCGWDNDPTSDTYRSCIVSDGKSGGDVVVEYNVTILSGAGTNEIFTSMFYDFSGSSYHYNADYATSARYVSVISALNFSKSFSDISVQENSTTTLNFVLENNGTSNVEDVTFVDNFPLLSGYQLTVDATPNITYSSGCISGPTLTILSGSTGVSFSGSVAGSDTCTVSVDVYVPPSTPEGTFINNSDNLYIGGLDTGQYATANLNVSTTSTGTGVCGVTLVSWQMTPGVTAENTDPPGPTTQSTTASIRTSNYITPALTQLTTVISTTIGNPVNSWEITGWGNTGNVVNFATDAFIEITIDTTDYTDVVYSFDAARSSSPAGPREIEVWSSTDGINFLQEAEYTGVDTTFTTFSESTLTTNPSGDTIFRIYGLDPQNTGNGPNMYLDNIIFTGCGPAGDATLSKEFVPDMIAEGEESTLTFTLGNPNTGDLTNAEFTDTLPTGITVASPSLLSNTCLGTASASGSVISLTGGTISSAGCSISLRVTGATAGTFANTSGYITTNQSGTNDTSSGFGSDTLYIITPPAFDKQFSPNPIYAGDDSILTFTISNANNIALSDIGFSDTLPANLLVSDPSGAVSSNCNALADPAFALTATPGSDTITLSSASIAAYSTCTVNVRVTSALVGDYNNVVSLTTGISGLVVEDASDTLAVIDHYPSITVLKQVGPTANGPWSSYMNTALGSDVYYRIQVENTGDVALSGLSVTDDQYTLSSYCSWPSILPAASPTQDPTVTCIFTPGTAQAGGLTNTVDVSASYGGTAYTDDSSATYAISDLLLNKTALTPSFSVAGNTINYQYVLQNNGSAILAGPVTVTDNRVTVSCPSLSGIGNGDGNLDPGESITCTATYTVTSLDVDTGSVTNSAYATVNGERSNTDRETVYVNLADLTISKTNDIGGFGTLGTAFNWEVTVSNPGPVAADFSDGVQILVDTLPAAATINSANVTASTNISGTGSILCSIASPTVTCSASGGNVVIGASSGSFTVSISATINTTGSFQNTAETDTGHNITESNESNNTAANSVYISSSSAAISLSKTPDTTTVIAAGATVNYDYIITNTGAVTLNGPFTVTDDRVTVTCDAVPGGGLAPTGTLDCSATYTITQADMDAGSVTNTATASSSTDGVTSNTVQATVNATQSPELLLEKSATPIFYENLGDIISYSYELTNTGNVTLIAPFTVTDNVVSVTCPSSPVSLAPLDSITCTASHTVVQTNLDAGFITNTATGHANHGATTINSNDDSVTVDLANPELAITKTANPLTYDSVGDSINYNYEIENMGNVTLDGPFSVEDDQLGTLSCPSAPATLDPAETFTCTDSATITQTNLDDGSLVNEVYVTGYYGSTLITSDVDSATVTATQTSSIGLAKELTSGPTEVNGNPGVYRFTFTFVVENFGNVSLSGIQVTDVLATALAGSNGAGENNTYTIVSLVSSDFTVNPGYDGDTAQELLDGTDSLAGQSSGTITMIVEFTPVNSGDYENSAIVEGTDPGLNSFSDRSQDGDNPDPDNDDDPTNNNDPTVVSFGADIFDPPSGEKIFDDAGYPLLRWTAVWINADNIVAVHVRSTDEIPVGTTFAGTPSLTGTLPALPQAGDSAIGVQCTPASALTTTISCYYEAGTPSSTYPRGRIIWEGNLGPDYGANNAAEAANEITIIYDLNVDAGITSVQNIMEIDLDADNIDGFEVPDEIAVASASRTWPDSAAVADEDELPNSGFAFENQLVMRDPMAAKPYAMSSDMMLTIPSLGVKARVVGIPYSNDEWNVSWLNNDAGWLNGTAYPTWQGNSVITGHVWDAYNQPGIFHDLKQLSYGQQIKIDLYGSTYIYEVRENRLIFPRNINLALQHEDTSWITLLTCEGYRGDEGNYQYRRIVRAVLIKVE